LKHDNPPITYYVGSADGERDGAMLGLGDFLFYNISLLLVLSLYVPTTIKIFVTLGCIVSVQVGYFATIMVFERLWKLDGIPALPLPVITFSVYFLILDYVVTSLSKCIEFS
jgi:hypothetical protein